MPRPRTWIAVAALLGAAFVAGRLSFAEEEPKTVKALRYRILWADSALELSHFGGRWVQEIYLPEQKVACALVFEYPQPTDLAKPGRRPRLYAYPTKRPRNDLTGLKNPKPSPIEEIEIPAAVAEEIVRLVELTRKQQRETWRLGKTIAAQGLLRELPLAGFPGSK